MNEAMKARLLEYARELVDQKIAEKQLFAGTNVSIMDKMISLQHGVFERVTEVARAWVRVWAEITVVQTTTPDPGEAAGGGAVQDGVFTYPATPIFTLPAEDPSRQSVLDSLEYYLDNAQEYSSPLILLYSVSPYPILNVPGGSWSQTQYPPYPPVFPGFTVDPDEHVPLRVGTGDVPFSFDDPPGTPRWGTVTKTAYVTLYVRAHSFETLGDFELGGKVNLYKLTLRQVGRTVVGGNVKQIAVVSTENTDHTGKSILVSPVSSGGYTNIDEIVHLIGFEPLTS